MGILTQLMHLFWKNILLRIRSPGILILELIWPVLIVGIISIMRLGAPPSKQGNCHYHPRAMPSAGAVPFIQTFMCNLNNKCYRSEQYLEVAQTFMQPFSDLSQDLGPLLASNQVLDILAVSDQTTQVFATLNKIVGDKQLIHGLDRVLNISNYFRDPDEVKDKLVNQLKLLSPDQADALLGAELNVEQLLNLTGTPDFDTIACDPIELGKFVKFPDGSNLTAISESLCNLTESQVEDVSNLLFRQVNISTLINAIKMIETVKDTLDGGSGLTFALEAVARMFEVVMRSQSLIGLLGDFGAIPDVADLIRKIPSFIRQYDDFQSIMNVLKEITNALNPLITSLRLQQSPYWLIAQDAVLVTEHLTLLVEGKWNGTSEEFTYPLTHLVTNLKLLAKDEGSNAFMAVLDFISRNNWLGIYDEIIYTQTLSEGTINTMANSVQSILEQTDIWSDFQKGIRLSYHTLDVFSLLTEKSIELRQALGTLFSEKAFVNALNKILQYGPVATNVFLDVIRNTQVIGDIMRSATTYQDVCERIVREMRGKLPDDIQSDVRDVLCSEDKDFARVMNTITEKLNISELSELINNTVQDVEKLYEGEFFTDSVKLADFFPHYSRFTKALNSYLYDDLAWMTVFRDISMSFDTINPNGKGWEPIADMLNGDYISSLILGLYQGFGQALGNSRISHDIAPGVHTLSELMEGIYGLLDYTGQLMSPKSELAQLVRLFTAYMPEMIKGISYMWDNNMSDLYYLAMNPDPLKTFCDNNYINKMNLPSHVPADQMNDLICKTDWNTFIQEMDGKAANMNSLAVQIGNAFMVNESASYNVQQEWSKMVDYTSRLWDLIRNGEVAGVIDLTSSSISFFNQFNFSRIEEAMDVLTAELNGIDTEDLEKFMELGIKVIESMDQNAGDSPEWQEIRRYMAIVDIYLEQQLNAINQSQTTSSLSDILKMFPKDMRTITVLLSKAYPQFVTALANIFYNPQEFFSGLVRKGFNTPDCQTHFVMDYIQLPQDSGPHELEKFVCNLNVTDLLIQLMQTQATSDISNRLTELIEGKPVTVPANYTRIISNFKAFLEFYNTPMANNGGGFDLAPFNVTAINLSWEQFYRAARLLEQFDPNTIQELINGIQEMFVQLMVSISGDEEGLIKAVYTQSYVSHITMKLLIEEMKYFNESSEVIIFDYLGSSELRKLSSLLTMSPDINAVGVATLQRILTSPKQAVISIVLEDLCANLSRFTDVFVTEVSSIQPSILQKTICDTILTIDFELVFDQVFNHRKSFRDFLQAMYIFDTNFTAADIQVSVGTMMKESGQIGELITDLIMDPPVIKITADESWMDMSLYAKEWEKLEEKLSILGNSSSTTNIATEVIAASVTILNAIPGASEMFHSIDVILDFVQSQLDQTDALVETISQYPNAKKIIDLLEEAPEAIQTLIYTVMTQPKKIAAWTEALQSWDKFCGTPTDSIFTVPPGITFSMSDFVSKACSIDIEELAREMGESQSVEALMNLFLNPTNGSGNASITQEKINHLVKSITDLSTNPEDMAQLNLRIIDEAVWNQVGARIANWSRSVEKTYMSRLNDSIIMIISEAIMSARNSFPPEIRGPFDKALAISNVAFTEMLAILNATSIEEAFREIPTMKTFVSLLDQVPELFESLVYTSINHPEQISAKLSGVTSLEGFCSNKPEEILTPAPNTILNLDVWMQTLCSLNVTQFVEDLMKYKAVLQITSLIEQPVTNPPQISSIIGKVEKLIQKVQGNVNLRDRIFDPDVWKNVIESITSWIWPYKSVEEFIAQQQQTLSVGILTYLENMPGTSDGLQYLDAVLDIIGKRTSAVKESFPEAFSGFPTLQTMVELLQQVPEMLETVLYTITTQPDKIAAWSKALMSFPDFCATPASEIMKEPPGSGFNVTRYLAKLCTIDIDALVNELNSNQLVERFNHLEKGNDTQALNVTNVTKKLTQLLHSLESFYINPSLESMPFNLRLFNETVWQEIGMKIERWSNSSMKSYGSPQSIVDVINQFFGSMEDAVPELYDAYEKALKIATVLTNQVLDIVKDGSFEEFFKDTPGMRKLIHLADSLPELFEILVYTSLNNPEKVASRAQSLTSLEKFCTSQPQNMFSIPPTSTFDLIDWLTEFCSLNLTEIETYVVNFKAAKDIENIINDSSNIKANLTSVLLRIDSLMEQFKKQLIPTDRFLNETVWSQVMSRLSTWISTEDLVMKSPLLSAGGVYLLLNQLSESDPVLKEMFRPVAAMMAVLDDLMDHVLRLDNKASFGITELFEGWTSMQQMMRFIQLPGVLDVLLASSTSKATLSSLFSEQGLADFCSPATDPTKYLTAPKDTSVDLSQMRSEFCKIDFNNFIDNIDSFINIHKLEAVANGSMEYDWSSLENKVTMMTNLINKWIEQPPIFDVPSNWMNESYWQNLLDSQILPLENTLTARDQIMILIEQLRPLLDMEGLKQTGIVLNAVLDILNDNIKAMQGADYTLENMFSQIPGLRELFDGLGLDSVTFQSLLVAPVKNTTLFAEILMSDDVRRDFCVTNKWSEVIKFPADFNTSALYSAFCNDNIGDLSKKLQSNFNLETMLATLLDGKSHIQDWKNASLKVFTLIESFQNLIDNPPTFNVDKTLSILNENYNLTTLMNLASVYSALQQSFMNESEIFQPLSSVFNIAQVMVNFLDDIMARVRLQNGRLDLASLFRDVPEFQKLISSVLDINPDPVTGLFAVQLYPEKVDEFISMASNTTQLMNLFCSKTKFEQIFDVSPNVNLSSALNVLCGFDFKSLAEELSKAFKVDSLTNEISRAMSSRYPFDVEKLTETVNTLISHIMNLTSTKQVTFQGRDLEDVFMLNLTQLLSELNGQSNSLGTAFTGDYAAISSQIVGTVLKELRGFTDIKEVSSALRFIQAYLHSFNAFLKSIKDQPVSLALLLNNTEVGRILNPILTDPHSLDALIDATINIEKLGELLNRPSPVEALCGNELWTAINITEPNSRQAFLDVQNAICSVNQSLLLWQTVMLQANGYQLYQQIEFINKDLQHGKSSVDTNQIGEEMSEFITLMNTLISQYANGTRSFENLIDVKSFLSLLDNLQGQLSKKLMETAEYWSVSVAEILLPNILDQNIYNGMAKTLNTMNLFMRVTIGQLQRIKDGTISASTLFNNADALINLMESYIRTGKNLARTWSNNELNMENFVKLFGDMDQLTALCAQPNGISMAISNTTTPSQTAKDIATVICSVLGSQVTDELKKFIDFDYIERTLTATWASPQVDPNYTAFVDNVKNFTSLVQDLSSTSYNISSSLLNLFNFGSIFDNIANIAQTPEIIFRLLKLLGIAIESPLRNEPEAVKTLSQMNSFVLMPLVHILEALKVKGLSLVNIAENPDALFNIMSVAVDFNVHFKIIKEIVIKPQIYALQTQRNEVCSNADDQEYIQRLLSEIQLPVDGKDILAVVCNSSSSQWLSKFEDMGLTNIQITVMLDQLVGQNDLLKMYDGNFGWVQLMSSMERLTSLVSGSGDKSKEDIDSIKTVWDHVKDLLFDKSFKSLLSYLQLFDGSQPYDEGWIKFKQFLNFFTSVMKFLDNNLENVNGNGVPIQLKDILPHTDEISKLLRDLFGAQSAAEFLVTAVNPTKLYSISMSGTWDTICNESSSQVFTMYFQFPSGTNVEALKKSICQAALKRTTSFQQLISLFNAGDVLKQLNMLIQGQHNASNHVNVNVWDATHSVMMHLIGTIENLQHAMLEATSVQDYFMPILNTLGSLSGTQNSQFENMCTALAFYLNETDGYIEAKQMISYAITTTNLMTDVFTMLPDLDKIVCALGTTERLDLAAFVQKVADLGFMKMVEKAVTAYLSPSNVLDCSAPFSSSETVINILNSTMDGNIVNVPALETCVRNVDTGIRDVLSSVTNAADFIRTFGAVLQMPEIANLFQDDELEQVLDFFIKTVNSNINGILSLGDLLEDRVSVSQYLTRVLGLSDTLVTTFMNATVNENWAYIFNRTTSEIEDILCDPVRLSKVITLPEGPLISVENISSQLCPLNKDVANFLKNTSISWTEVAKRLASGTNLLDIITLLTDDLSKIIVDFQDIIKFLIDLLSNFNITTLFNDIDLLDKILKGNELTELAKRIQSMLQTLKHLVDDPILMGVLNDVEKIVDGLLSIDIIKNRTMDSLRVKDLVDDPDGLRSYLLNELGMSEQQANNILNGAFSFRVILGIDEKPTLTCENVFGMLIILNDTQTTQQELKNVFCSLDNDQLRELFNALKVQLNIGNLVSRYVSNTADTILKSTNLTKTELNDVVQKIDSGQYFLSQATDIIYKNTNGSDFLNIFSQGSAEAFTDMDQLVPLLCGEGVDDIFASDFTPGVLISTKDNLADDIKDGLHDNIDDLPNQFCIDIYEAVRASELGSILWAYLKPIMRGKILYTPVNDVTMEIVRKANKTFELLEDVQRVANIWATGTSDLKAMMQAANDTEDLRDVLENDFIRGILKATIGVSADQIVSGLDALQSNNFGPKELNALQTAATLVANLTSCLEFDRYQGVESEEELEEIAFQLTQRKIFFAGIVFLNSDDAPNSNSSTSGQNRRKRQATKTIPKHVSYKIRMDVDNVMDTNHLKASIWTMTAEDNFLEHLRYMRGFIFLQDMLDYAIIDIHKDPAHTIPGAQLKQMPFPCHHVDNFIFVLGTYLVPVMMTFVFLASLGVATYNLIYDRENGQEQALQVMGMKSGINFFVWLISTLLVNAFVSLIMAVMLKCTEIFIYSNGFLLALFILNFCLSSVMLLYMVSAFFNRTTIAILFVLMIYLISYLPYILVISLELDMKFWQKILACLASTTAFSFGAHNLAKLEEIGEGLQWSNIRSEASLNFSLHWACMMMLIDSGIYFIIGWYVRHIRPGKYGIPQPWYFPLNPCFWSSCFKCCCKPGSHKERTTHARSSLFEIPSQGLDVGITIENLSKSYGKKEVLSNMNMRIYKGQITCLLGHNGAAKTTTLKMLYGMLEPSSGRIEVNGKSPSECKNTLGICPQQNTLFDYMNVLEHMRFYAGVKQSTKTSATLNEIKKLLDDVDLWHERHVQAKNLSYGMKRRLCVALAFVGGSDTVVLDEPTSGIDPHARRNIWNLITSNKEGRTILLSTHHLDEADIIGDHIAIMHTGRLLCFGSPAFLKKAIGGGFKLSIMKSSEMGHQEAQDEAGQAARAGPESKDDVILKFIKSMYPEAEITGRRGNDLWINITKDERMMKVPFQLFFQELDQKSKDLGIVGYGLSDTTLEEIFLKLTHYGDMERDGGIVNQAMEVEQEDPEAGLPSNRSNDIEKEDSTFFKPGLRIHYDQGENLRKESLFDGSMSSNVDVKRRKQGFSLKFQQIVALFIKRCTHYRRNWRMLLTCIVLPLLAFLIAMAFSTIRPDEGNSKALLMDPTIYGQHSVTFFKKAKEADNFKADLVTKGFRDSDIGIGTTCMADYDAHETGFSVDCIDKSAPINKTTPFFLNVCQDARQRYHRLGTVVSKVEERLTPNQLYQQNLDGHSISTYLMRTFRDYKDKRFGGWSVEESKDNGAAQVDSYVWFNSKGYHSVPSFYNSLTNVLLRTHLPQGENPDDYGITAINHPVHMGRNALSMKNVQNDAADAGIAIMVVIAFSFIACGVMLYTIGERNQKEKQLQHISGVGLSMYWITTFIWDLIVYAAAVGVAVGIVAIFKTDSFYLRDNLGAFAVVLLMYGWALIPFQYFFSHFFKKGSTAFLVSFCLNLFLCIASICTLLVLQLFREIDVAWKAYKVCRYIYLIFPQYALGQGLMEMVANTVKYKILIRFDEDLYVDPYSLDILGWHLIALAIFGFVFFIINLLWESKKASALSMGKKNRYENKDMDVDVAKEKERILHASNNDVLIVDNLSKVYRRNWKKFSAVDNISFGVPEGESFGLLGVNGAGKTTTFRMLTGDSTSSSGTAMLNGAKISSKSHQLRQGVGYCPQEGGLDEYMTGTETLYFHARLRGFDSEQTKAIVDELLSELQLRPYANKAVHTYSGGTKRKLALAVAMLGKPPILYLDEPTTGMDAATRRLAWKCILKANHNGQSVVLTSHMMDECDALCSKIAIMVNGEIKCIGSPQHLKQRFGDGYNVIIHGNNELLRSVAASFLNMFPGSVIQTRHFTSLQIMIPHNCGHVADILTYLQHSQKEGLLEYYSLSQTTLDSVFISFAQEQSDHLYDPNSTYTPSGSQSDTPTGSISSSKSPPSYSIGQHSKKDKDRAFMTPQFVNSAYLNDGDDSYPRPRLDTNIAIGSNTMLDAPQSEPRYVSNIFVKNQQEPDYDNANSSFSTKL